eukprot:877921-Prymnesium_polylepis.1
MERGDGISLVLKGEALVVRSARGVRRARGRCHVRPRYVVCGPVPSGRVRPGMIRASADAAPRRAAAGARGGWRQLGLAAS